MNTNILTKLQDFDTPTICNVIELFNVRPRTAGYMNAHIRANFPKLKPMVGYAATVTYQTAISPRNNDAKLQLTQQVEKFSELSGSPIIVSQDLDNPIVAATFGELMCTIFQAFGAVGIISNGAGRDLEQILAIDFPVFSNGTICSHGYIRTIDLHVPVHVGGIAVYPNDLLHGDANGVTTIPISIASDVADVAGEFIAAEQIILDSLHETPAQIHILKKALAEKNEHIAELRKRIASKRDA